MGDSLYIGCLSLPCVCVFHPLLPSSAVALSRIVYSSRFVPCAALLCKVWSCINPLVFLRAYVLLFLMCVDCLLFHVWYMVAWPKVPLSGSPMYMSRGALFLILLMSGSISCSCVAPWGCKLCIAGPIHTFSGISFTFSVSSSSGALKVVCIHSAHRAILPG